MCDVMTKECMPSIFLLLSFFIGKKDIFGGRSKL